MLDKILHEFLLSLVVTFSFFSALASILLLIWANQPKKERGEKRKPATRKEALSVIAKSVQSLIVSTREEDDRRRYRHHFFVTSEDNGIAEAEIYGFFNRYVIPVNGFSCLELYQGLFDQVLKSRAENLQAVYDREKNLEDRYRDEKKIRSSLFRDEIEAILEKEEMNKRDKEHAEKRFWSLHDALRDLGLKTWGSRSFKVYLVLKPGEPKLPISD